MVLKDYLNLIIRKPVFALCEQQRRRLACTSAQSDQHLCCSLLRQYNVCSRYVLNFKTIASLGHGFDPGPRHTKVVKNGTSCSSLGTQIYGVELGLVDPVSG